MDIPHVVILLCPPPFFPEVIYFSVQAKFLRELGCLVRYTADYSVKRLLLPLFFEVPVCVMLIFCGAVTFHHHPTDVLFVSQGTEDSFSFMRY